MPRFATAAASYRLNTEDRAIVLQAEAGWIVCVADGTGGISGGARASEVFVSGIQRAVLASKFSLTDPTAWSALVEELDHAIADEPSAGETTGIALAVTSGLVVGASCGDSRAYLHTQLGWHELTSHQLRKPRLGTGRAKARPFVTEASGRLVVGTDGLFDYAVLDDMARALPHGPDEAGDALVRLVLARHRVPPDDIAVVVGWLD